MDTMGPIQVPITTATVRSSSEGVESRSGRSRDGHPAVRSSSTLVDLSKTIILGLSAGAGYYALHRLGSSRTLRRSLRYVGSSCRRFIRDGVGANGGCGLPVLLLLFHPCGCGDSGILFPLLLSLAIGTSAFDGGLEPDGGGPDREQANDTTTGGEDDSDDEQRQQANSKARESVRRKRGAIDLKFTTVNDGPARPSGPLQERDESKKDVKGPPQFPPSLSARQPPHKEPDAIRRGSNATAQTEEGGESASSSLAGGGGGGVRFLEMLVHNVSHTDLVLGLGLGQCDENNIGDNCGSPLRHPTLGDDPNGEETLTPRVCNAASGPAKKNIGGDNRHGGGCVPCRPRFSAFDLFSRRVLDALRPHHTSSDSSESCVNINELLSTIISYPRYERSDATPRYSIVTPRPSRQRMLPVGFDLSWLDAGNGIRVDPGELPSLRLRGRDASKVGDWCKDNRVGLAATDASAMTPSGKGLHLNSVFFPLLSTLLPRWHAQIADKYSAWTSSSSSPDHTPPGQGQMQKRNIKRIMVLVSGVGTPRNWTHSITGNSTEACAELMEIFINVLYPDVTVVRIHSETNIFRYDENLRFTKRELMPCIDAYRDAHARGESYPDETNASELTTSDWSTAFAGNNAVAALQGEREERNAFNPDWKSSFSVTLSFADGSPARTHAIQASLRPYRPTYFHFWQLKTFWHESKICGDDIEVHSFEEMETVPAMEVGQTNENVRLVVEEMKKFRECFLETAKVGGRNDIRQFWLRKTRKPVLAVLLVERPDGQLILYRGTNMEVSMPTGSLCAERNVIGTALASNPGLKREDLRLVAVLAVPLPEKETPTKHMAAIPPPPPMVDAMLCAPVAVPTEVGAPLSQHREGTSLFVAEVEEKLARHQRPENIRRSMSVASFASIVECTAGEEECETDNDEEALSASWVIDKGIEAAAGHSDTIASVSPNLPPIPAADTGSAGIVIPPLNLGQVSSSHNRADEIDSSLSPPGTPVRKIKLYSDGDEDSEASGCDPVSGGRVGGNASAATAAPGTGKTAAIAKPTMGGGLRKKKRTVVVHSSEDINPLRPCGSCNEWLKKIAESNPHFRVMTFTDADCNGVYVSPCQE